MPRRQLTNGIQHFVVHVQERRLKRSQGPHQRSPVILNATASQLFSERFGTGCMGTKRYGKLLVF